MVDKINLMKELRLVDSDKYLVIAALRLYHVPADIVSSIYGMSKEAVYNTFKRFKDKIPVKVLNDVRRAVIYASVRFKVYKVLNVIVITAEQDVPPKKFRMFPPTYREQDIINFISKGNYTEVKLEDTVFANKTFSQILSETR